MLSNLFIYCLPCRKLEGCLAKHFRTVSSFPEWSWIRPHLKRTTAGVQRSKKFKSVGPRSHVTLASRKFSDCDGASAFLRFSTANAHFRWSSRSSSRKTISRQTNLKVMDLFDIQAARNCQDFKDTFILLILCLVISTNLNFSPFCQLHFYRHMFMLKYVLSTLKASILWQLSCKELLRNLSLPIYQILDAKYLTLQLLG